MVKLAAIFASCAGVVGLSLGSFAQPTSRSPLAPPPNGVRQSEPADGWVALTGATIHVSPERTIERGTLVIRAGKIVSVGEQAPPPDGAMVRDVGGMHIYPGFIEPYVEVDAPKPDGDAPGSHWNPRVMPQRSPLDQGAGGLSASDTRELRELGFVAAVLSPKGGIFRGTGAAVSLAERSADPSDVRPPVYAERVYHSIAFELSREDGGRGPGDDPKWSRYPDSQMGAIALIRQTLSDAKWHQDQSTAQGSSGPMDALVALRAPDTLLFNTDDELEALRGVKIAKEFGRSAMILGSGMEFRRLQAIAESKVPVIVPLAFLKTPSVGTIGEMESVELTDLIDWEQAPTNPRRLVAAGVPIAFTTSKVPSKAGGRGAFNERLSAALKHGLKPQDALAALTTTPAKLLGLDKQLGTLENGKVASFIVADGQLLTDRPDAPRKGETGYVRAGRIIDVWIDGHRHGVRPRERNDLEGTWTVTLEPGPKDNHIRALEFDDSWPPKITITERDAPDAKPASGEARNVTFETNVSGGAPTRFSFVFDHEPFGDPGVFSVDASVEQDAAGQPVIVGTLVRSNGKAVKLTAKRTGDVQKEVRKRDFDATWTRVIDGRPIRPETLPHTHVVIWSRSSDRKIEVHRGDDELETEVVQFSPEADPAKFIVRTKGVDANKPEEWTTYVLVGIKGRPDRLSMRASEDGPEIGVLGRMKESPESDAIAAIPEALGLPLGPYALPALPEQGTIVIRNVTIWTVTDKGVIENGSLVISGGKIAVVGGADAAGEWLSRVRLSSPPVEIDAKGKHVVPGIIDCHSHTGISKGVNEAGQAVTAEVRIGDVTNPDSISWYRQLAGGVTSVNNLHGSANAIGGQNQVNKIRWGCVAPDDMHFEGAIGGIKFALGENVKQSNWGDRFNSRYPQTRMGVEMLLRDRFTAAREYLAAIKAGGDRTPRRDLELEALGEILEGKRLVHCHSYRQDEILMLCRVASEFGFQIGTFQHGLEVYKVADEVKKVAIGASLFSDWWAYKVEVQDAIPSAGPLQSEVGVLTSYNSDSDELARRMNVEAGKAVKYSGGLPDAPGKKLTPEEALKFVTINPAKQLKIDDRVGSLEAGKDADLAIWSGPPLSSLSRCERTFVDGRELFSLEQDAAHRKAIAAERTRIIQKILSAGSRKSERNRKPGIDKKPETPDMKPGSSDEPARSRASLMQRMADEAEDRRREHYMNMIRRGLDPRFHMAGQCGCETW